MIGLTGGIGAGKSEVARRLAVRGAVVVDSDVIARAVVAPGTHGLRHLVAEFGEQIVAADGSLDRPALAAVAFADPDARRRLDAIVHPLVREQTAVQVLAAAERDADAIVVNDVPLLVESGLVDSYAAVVVVDVPPEVQLERLTSVRGMSAADARARIAAQATRTERLAAATYVVDNTGDLDALDIQVAALWPRLVALADPAEPTATQ